MRLLLKSFFGTASITLLGKVISILGMIIFARFLSVEDYGRYGYIMSIIAIASIPVTTGLPSLFVRELSKYKLNNQITLLNGIKRWVFGVVIGYSFIAILVIYILSNMVDSFKDLGFLLILSLLIIPMKGGIYNLSAIINAYERPALAQTPITLLFPLLTIAVFLFIYIFSISPGLDGLVFSVVTAFALTLCFTLFLIRKLPKFKINGYKYLGSHWTKALIPFTLVSTISTVNIELASIYLGRFSTHEQIAFFKVAFQSVSLIALGLVAVNVVIRPRIVKMYSLGDLLGVQKLITDSTRLGFFISTPLIIVAILLGENLLGFIFGYKYSEAYGVLVILSISQFINVASGPVGLILNMIGKEKSVATILGGVLFVNILAMFIIIPDYGATGAAACVLLCEIIYSTSLTILLYKETKLKSWIK